MTRVMEALKNKQSVAPIPTVRPFFSIFSTTSLPSYPRAVLIMSEVLN